jgi:hypothetical protein
MVSRSGRLRLIPVPCRRLLLSSIFTPFSPCGVRIRGPINRIRCMSVASERTCLRVQICLNGRCEFRGDKYCVPGTSFAHHSQFTAPGGALLRRRRREEGARGFGQVQAGDGVGDLLVAAPADEQAVPLGIVGDGRGVEGRGRSARPRRRSASRPRTATPRGPTTRTSRGRRETLWTRSRRGR